MRTLAQLAPPGTITPLVFLDPPQHLLAMQAVPRPHENWKTMLLAGRVEGDHVRQFSRLLAAIHAAGRRQREQFGVEFEDRSFFESLRLEPYYLYSAGQLPAAAAFLQALVDETRATRQTLVHGDFSPKNVLVHDGLLILLDHEVIHFGDGAFDLGFALTHLLSKANAMPPLRRVFGDAARLFWQTYADDQRTAAADLEPRACRHTLGCLLARCVGRSPLEYLGAEASARQVRAAMRMIGSPPRRIDDLVAQFVNGI